jgi:signal transduction histidine kinase
MKFKVSITQQFLLFLILVSIVPILLVSTLFYQDIESKFNERVNNILTLGALVAEDTVRNDLETLFMSTRQAASFSVHQSLYQYLSSPQGRDWEMSKRALRQLQHLRHLNRVMVYNSSGKVAYQSGHPITPSMQVLIQEALRGKTQATIEQEYSPEAKRYILSYISTAPIVLEAGTEKHTLGVLLSSYSMEDHFSLQDILKIFPQLDIRIIVNSPQGLHVLSSSSTELMTIQNNQALSGLNLAKPAKSLMTSNYFTEVFHHETYRSLAIPLRARQEKAIGYIVVSTSENDFADLKKKNILYICGYLIFVSLLIAVASFVFRNSIIRPIDELASLSEEVAKGNLTLRVFDQQAHEKIHNMMSNFNKMLIQLEEDNLLKTTFVSTLTHDLRTPLFAQKRVLEALEKRKHQYDPDLQEMLQVIQQGNQQLLDMVNKILEAYQYEAGRITIFPEPLDLQRLVSACFQELLPLARGKDINLINAVTPEFFVYADSEQLKRVFQNLVSNALANIQAHRQVVISAHDCGHFVQIEVKDNGPGIPVELQEQLFQRYFTGHSKQKIGSGLGLFICRMIMELHGGSIEVSSEPGQGTLFTLILPSRPEEANDHG